MILLKSLELRTNVGHINYEVKSFAPLYFFATIGGKMLTERKAFLWRIEGYLGLKWYYIPVCPSWPVVVSSPFLFIIDFFPFSWAAASTVKVPLVTMISPFSKPDKTR